MTATLLSSFQPSLMMQESQYPIRVLLIDDQKIIEEAIRLLLDGEPNVTLHYCSDASQAISEAIRFSPTVILQDLVMPKIDGLVLVKYLKANPATRDVPLIVLSSREDAKVKAEAFALGANDYMVKIPQKEELIARIRYHSKSYIRLLERNLAYEKLEESQNALTQELNEAAVYVKSLLPPPLSGDIQAAWRFVPSMQLGGDAFGYHWLDDKHFAIYLLDVCGHGVGAALLSISVINVLRSQTLSHTNFHSPANVLVSLNHAFPMEKHNNMFFTIWYGVYHKVTRKLMYASGGHPPAILISQTHSKELQVDQLSTKGLMVGGMEDADFTENSHILPPNAKLFLFSDGAFEIARDDGTMMQYLDFVEIVKRSSTETPEKCIASLLSQVRELNKERPFVDDVSILEVSFS